MLKNFSKLSLSMLISVRHSVKSVHIRSYSGPYFPTFGLNTEKYYVSLRIQCEPGKIRTKISLNTDTFYAVILSKKNVLRN